MIKNYGPNFIARRFCKRAWQKSCEIWLIPTRREPGCVSYDLFQNNDDPLEFVTIEHWTDQAAADAHLTAPHVVAAIANAGDLLAQPPAIHRYTRIS
ncbi:putative quinol monooxygenase [Undibacterium arcticum]